MANEQNLIPNSERTPSELREITKKGGKKSAQVRAEKKKFKDLFDSYLSKQVTDEKLKEQMKDYGFTDKELTNKNAMVLAQFGKALKGNTQAFIAIRDTIGEQVVQKVEDITTPKIVDDV